MHDHDQQFVFICTLNSDREPYLLTTLGACIPNSGRLIRTPPTIPVRQYILLGESPILLPVGTILQNQGRSQKISKGGVKSGKGKSRAKFFAFFLCKRDQNRTKTEKM